MRTISEAYVLANALTCFWVGDADVTVTSTRIADLSFRMSL